MTPVVESLFQGVPVLLLHLAVSVIVLVAALWIYMAVSPYRQVALVRSGNTAAAVVLAGAAVSLALPLAFCLAGAVNALDIALWGIVTLSVQVIVAVLVDLLILPNLPRRIASGDMAAAALVTGLKLSMAVLLAAAVAV